MISAQFNEMVTTDVDDDPWNQPRNQKFVKQFDEWFEKATKEEVIQFIRDSKITEEHVSNLWDTLWTTYWNAEVKWPWRSVTHFIQDVYHPENQLTLDLERITPMTRKPQELLNELAAQLFPFCAADFLDSSESDDVIEISQLPTFMDKAVSLCNTLLPVDEVYVAKRILSKLEANLNCTDEDTPQFVSNWFCTVILDLDSTNEFWAKMCA